MHHSQKGKALVWGLSTRKTWTPRLIQNSKTRVELVPQAAPVGRLEVEGVDVLVFLGRIFGVLDGAVGADDEPFGMLGDPGMVGRALEGDVERDLHAMAWAAATRWSKSAKVPSSGMDGCVAAFAASRWPRGCRDRLASAVTVLLRPFAEGGADGVDGRQVEHVEAHGGDLGQERFDVGEGAVPAGIGRGGAGKELVPGGVAGALAVDPERQLCW